MSISSAIVYIIDDDASVRRAFKRLINSAGIKAEMFESVSKFLAWDKIALNECCIVADLRMRESTGMDLHRELAKRGVEVPLIFVTGHDSEESRNEAKALGAAAYFRKPVDDQALLDAIDLALEFAVSSRELSGNCGHFRVVSTWKG